MRHQLPPPSLNPVSRLLTGLAAVLLLIGAAFFGVVVLLVVLGLGVLGWVVLSLRIWWLRRQAGSGPDRTEPHGDGRARGQGRAGGDVIDADYEVISRRREN